MTATCKRVLDNARDLGSLENVAVLDLVVLVLFGVPFGLIMLGGGLDLCQVGSPASWPGWAASRDTAGAPVVGVFLAGSVIGLTVLAGLFLRPPVRPGHVILGRYVEILIPPLLALGLVRLWTAPTRRLAPALGVGTAIGARGGRDRRNEYHRQPRHARPCELVHRARAAPVGTDAGPDPASDGHARGVGWSCSAARRDPTVSHVGGARARMCPGGQLVALRVVLVGVTTPYTAPSPSPCRGWKGSTRRKESATTSRRTPIGLYSYQWQLGHARFLLFDSRRDPVPRTE